jgi:hypothetical protein
MARARGQRCFRSYTGIKEGQLNSGQFLFISIILTTIYAIIIECFQNII